MLQRKERKKIYQIFQDNWVAVGQICNVLVSPGSCFKLIVKVHFATILQKSGLSKAVCFVQGLFCLPPNQPEQNYQINLTSKFSNTPTSCFVKDQSPVIERI